MHTKALPAGDRGEIVSGWLVKLVGTLAVLGVVGFDAIACGMVHLRVQDAAAAGAMAGLHATEGRRNVQVAYDAAAAAVAQENPGYTVNPASVTFDPKGAVSITVSGTADTLVVHYVRPLRTYADATSTQTARPEA